MKGTPPADPVFGEGIGVGVRKDDTELLEKINAGIKGASRQRRIRPASRKNTSTSTSTAQGAELLGGLVDRATTHLVSPWWGEAESAQRGAR